MARKKTRPKQLTLKDIAPEPAAKPADDLEAAKAELAKIAAEADLIDAQTREKKTSMGLIGRAIGDHKHAPVGGVIVIILVVIVAMGMVAYHKPEYWGTYFEALKTFGTAALGFVGGMLTQKKILNDSADETSD